MPIPKTNLKNQVQKDRIFFYDCGTDIKNFILPHRDRTLHPPVRCKVRDWEGGKKIGQR